MVVPAIRYFKKESLQAFQPAHKTGIAIVPLQTSLFHHKVARAALLHPPTLKLPPSRKLRGKTIRQFADQQAELTLTRHSHLRIHQSSTLSHKYSNNTVKGLDGGSNTPAIFFLTIGDDAV